MEPSSRSNRQVEPGGPSESGEVDLAHRLAYLSLTDEDARRLQGMLPRFTEFQDQFVESFYAHLSAFPATRKFLRDQAMVALLKRRQKDHLTSMLAAEWSETYVRQRMQVGDTHAEIGVNPELFLGAYNQYLQFYVREYAAGESAKTREFLDELLSLMKATFLDIGLTLDAYFTRSTQSLRNALDMFLRANAELRQFAQLASHDLKTPLATVANLCEEALDEFGPEMPSEACELIKAAKSRTYRMSDMVDDLLSLTAETESASACEAVDCSSALEEAIDRLHPLMQEHDVHLVRSTSLPSVLGNRIRLREAFYNLLSNATKFIEKRPGTVEISSQISEDRAILCIADNGPGIPSDEIQRIFSPFRRLPAHRETPGSGLGLYFTKTLIEQQGGRIWVESDPGVGSRFFIDLPLVQSGADGAAEKL